MEVVKRRDDLCIYEGVIKFGYGSVSGCAWKEKWGMETLLGRPGQGLIL